MSRNLKPRIVAFFADHPSGASVQRLAEFLGSDNDSTVRSLRLLEQRGEAAIAKESALIPNSVWVLTIKATPPVFRAMETLLAMQNAARQA